MGKKARGPRPETWPSRGGAGRRDLRCGFGVYAETFHTLLTGDAVTGVNTCSGGRRIRDADASDGVTARALWAVAGRGARYLARPFDARFATCALVGVAAGDARVYVAEAKAADVAEVAGRSRVAGQLAVGVDADLVGVAVGVEAALE